MAVSKIVRISCKDAEFDFSQNPLYEKAQELALQTVSEMYRENQQEELEEMQEMLENGEIDDAEEYDGDYLDDFKPENFQNEIDKYTAQYMRNALNIPDKFVIEFPEVKTKDVKDSENAYRSITDEQLRTAIEEKYHVPLKAMPVHDKATPSEILSQMTYDNLDSMLDTKSFNAFLELKNNISKYSVNNIAMIYGQKPDASAVAGFNAWKNDYGRSIIKGESGLAIWQPSFKTMKTEKEIDKWVDSRYKYESDSFREDKRDELKKQLAAKGTAQDLYGFTIGYVFDISQTESIDKSKENKLQTLLDSQKPLGADCMFYEEVVVSMQTAMGEDADRSEKILKSGKSEQDKLLAVVKDYAEYILSEKPSSVVGIRGMESEKGAVHEMEVLIAASLICKHIGIEADEKLSADLAIAMDKAIDGTEGMTTGRHEIFKKAFDRGDKLSRQFIKEFDKEFEQQKDMVLMHDAELKNCCLDKGTDSVLLTAELEMTKDEMQELLQRAGMNVSVEEVSAVMSYEEKNGKAVSVEIRLETENGEMEFVDLKKSEEGILSQKGTEILEQMTEKEKDAKQADTPAL